MADITLNFLDLKKLQKDLQKAFSNELLKTRKDLPKLAAVIPSLSQKQTKDDSYKAFVLQFKLKDAPHGRKKTSTEDVIKYNSYKEYSYMKGKNVVFQVETEQSDVFRYNQFNEMIEKRFKTRPQENPKKRERGYWGKALGGGSYKIGKREGGKGSRWTKFAKEGLFKNDKENNLQYSISFPMSMGNFGKIPQRYLIKPLFDLYFPLVQEQGSDRFLQALAVEQQKTENLVSIKKINDLMEKSIKDIGNKMIILYRQWFDTRGAGSWKPNAPSTVRLKGRNRPMIETGALRDALTFDIITLNNLKLLKYAGWINPAKIGGAFERLSPEEKLYVMSLRGNQ